MRRWKGEEIRELRDRFTLTQKNLSELLGVTRTYVILLEKGVKTPSNTLCLLLNYVEKDLTDKQQRREGGYGKTKVKRRASH